MIRRDYSFNTHISNLLKTELYLLGIITGFTCLSFWIEKHRYNFPERYNLYFSLRYFKQNGDTELLKLFIIFIFIAVLYL